MADRSQPLILEALTRAVAVPTGLALHGSKSIPGLFAGSAAARLAARHCTDEGYLQVAHSETKGRKTTEFYAITEKGLAFLLKEVSPRPILEALVQALEKRGGEIGTLLAVAEQTRASFAALKATAEKVLQQLHERPQPSAPVHAAAPANGSSTWPLALLEHLHQRQQAGLLDDCPLPELLQVVRVKAAEISLGQFHDELRRLHAQAKIYLHPWTGPLYEMPEPTCALLTGHEIAYYASIRT